MKRAGAPGPQLAGGNHRAWGHERAGRHHRTLLDHGAVHHGRAHTHEGIVLDRARVEDGVVAHGDAIANRGWRGDTPDVCLCDVDDGVVLDVGHGPDGDAVGVAAEDRAVPYGRLLADGDVADDGGGGGDESRGGERGDLVVDASHGAMLADGLAEGVGALHGASDAIEHLSGLAEHGAEGEHDARHGFCGKSRGDGDRGGGETGAGGRSHRARLAHFRPTSEKRGAEGQSGTASARDARVARVDARDAAEGAFSTSHTPRSGLPGREDALAALPRLQKSSSRPRCGQGSRFAGQIRVGRGARDARASARGCGDRRTCG